MRIGNHFTKSNNESVTIPKRKYMVIGLFIILSILLVLQGCDSTNKQSHTIDAAIKKVSDLFEGENEEKIKEGTPSKIKDSTDQEQIHEAVEAIEKIDINVGDQSENEAVVFGLQTAALVAQSQLKEREGSESAFANDPQDEREVQFHPDEDDVVLKDNKLKNKDILEAFMDVAGENNDSHIRVVKDEGKKGVLIYDLESNYDKNADQGWINVTSDLSHYIPSKNDSQDVFNIGQQCGSLSKDEQEGYYKFNECQTHLEYRFLPIINDD